MQRRFGQAGQLFAEFNPHSLLAHFDQCSAIFLAAAIEQLQGIAHGMPQYAADVVGLGLG